MKILHSFKSKVKKLFHFRKGKLSNDERTTNEVRALDLVPVPGIKNCPICGSEMKRRRISYEKKSNQDAFIGVHDFNACKNVIVLLLYLVREH